MKNYNQIDYHPVVFQDERAGFAFLTRSTPNSEETILWADGNTYPLIKVEISSASHPAYTGKVHTRPIDGRVARFRQRFGISSK